VQITFDPTNPREVEQVLRYLIVGESEAAGVTSLSPGDGDVEEAASVGSDVVSSAETKKRGRKPKAETTGPEAVKLEPLHDPKDEDVLDMSVSTLEDARNALRRFTEAKGMTAAIDLLKSFDVSRVSELPPMDYDKFIKSCAA
jgi:hypothetical protein